MSTVYSRLVWKIANAAHPNPQRFTFKDLCFPQSDYREKILALMRKYQDDRIGVCMACDKAQSTPNLHPAFRWPASEGPTMQYAAEGSHRLCFRTLSATFRVLGSVYQRQGSYSMKHKTFQLRVCGDENYFVGYIDIPDPRQQPEGENLKNGIPSGLHEFVVLSRSTIGNFELALISHDADRFNIFNMTMM